MIFFPFYAVNCIFIRPLLSASPETRGSWMKVLPAAVFGGIEPDVATLKLSIIVVLPAPF